MPLEDLVKEWRKEAIRKWFSLDYTQRKEMELDKYMDKYVQARRVEYEVMTSS